METIYFILAHYTLTNNTILNIYIFIYIIVNCIFCFVIAFYNNSQIIYVIYLISCVHINVLFLLYVWTKPECFDWVNNQLEMHTWVSCEELQAFYTVGSFSGCFCNKFIDVTCSYVTRVCSMSNTHISSLWHHSKYSFTCRFTITIN